MKRTLTLLLLLGYSLTNGQVKLPRLFSDGMVIQREQRVKIWGWAAPAEKISVKFFGQTFTTQAAPDGQWSVTFPPQKAGGPHNLVVTASNTIVVNDVLVGDVWICSGQSNMELNFTRARDKYPDVIKESENRNIRQFLVADKYDFKKEYNDLDDGSWKSANPKNIMDFSAVAYFFAKEVYDKHRVPIGLINAALGGSPAEAWMSQDALKAYPDLYQEAQKFKDDKVITDIETADRNRSNQWYAELNSKDKGLSRWKDPNFSDADWTETAIPGYWADGTLGKVNGSVWFRKKINVPAAMVGKPGKIWMGRIVDADSVFLNGKFVGTTGYQYPPRKYEFGADVLKEGENIVAIRVINSGGKGGFVPDKPYFLTTGQDTIDLKGTWKMALGATMSPLEGGTTVRWKPSGLYNRMISPLLNYPIKGVIWYQGESNTRASKQYETLFPAMIKNWRTKFAQGDFPFLFVQLANFMDPQSQPSESEWAELRDAQRKTLALPNTGMAVIIDIGEWNDIHPLNKQDVGKRLALEAEALAYGNKKIVPAGPLYTSHKVKGNKVILSFSNTGSGLQSKGGAKLKYFAIAGSDKKFVWANAEIQGNTVVVWNDEIKKPVAVRYAWADNPEGANLYNKEGLPASPFKTDL